MVKTPLASLPSLPLVALLVACESSTGPDVADLDGFWDFTETMDVTVGASCSGTRFLNITQRGGSTSGTGFRTLQCTSPGPYAEAFSGVLEDGRIRHTRVSFAFRECRYQGRFTPDKDMPWHIAGQGCRTVQPGSQSSVLASSWAAER